MRFPEIGIRMALGSSQGGVVWLMAREMGGVLGAGIPLGLLATLAFENSGGPVAIRTPDLQRAGVEEVISSPERQVPVLVPDLLVKVLHHHQIAAGLVELRVQNRAPIGRDRDL